MTQKAKLLVFTKNKCGGCDTLKKYLDDNQFTYDTVNISLKENKIQRDFIRKHFKTIPITQAVIGNRTTFIDGIRPDLFEVLK